MSEIVPQEFDIAINNTFTDMILWNGFYAMQIVWDVVGKNYYFGPPKFDCADPSNLHAGGLGLRMQLLKQMVDSGQPYALAGQTRLVNAALQLAEKADQ